MPCCTLSEDLQIVGKANVSVACNGEVVLTGSS